MAGEAPEELVTAVQGSGDDCPYSRGLWGWHACLWVGQLDREWSVVTGQPEAQVLTSRHMPTQRAHGRPWCPCQGQALQEVDIGCPWCAAGATQAGGRWVTPAKFTAAEWLEPGLDPGLSGASASLRPHRPGLFPRLA